MPLSTLALRSLLLLVASASAPALGYGLATHAMVVGGQATAPVGSPPFTCATSGPQPRESAFFNTGVGLPTEGYAGCGLAGGIDNKTSTNSAIASHQATSFTSILGSGALTADARADYGSLGVAASGTYAGTQDSATYKGAEGAAYWSDSITIAGAGAGSIRLGFSVDGSTTTTGNSQTIIYLNYQFDGGPSFSAFVANSGFGLDRAINPTGVGPLSGFVTAPGSVSGADVAYSYLTPITFGQAFDLNIGFYAGAYAGGTADASWFSTARLSLIQVFNSAGVLVPFTATSASGTLYDATGAHPVPVGGTVPEPASWSLLIAGFGITGAALRRRRTTVSA